MMLAERAYQALDLDLAKKALIGLSVAALLMLPIDALQIFLKKNSSKAIASLTAEKKNLPWETENVYLSAIEGSALFGAPQASQVPMMQASATELVKDYRLKGIVLGGESEAIVEDAKTQRTSFLKVGSQLGNLVVKEIKEGEIILNYLGSDVRMEIQ